MSSQLPLFLRQEPPAGARQRVELGPPVVLGRAPLGGDGAFLFELEQGGVDGAVVEGQPAAAGLLDPPRQPVAVLRAHRRERLQHHQGEGALPDVRLIAHPCLPARLARSRAVSTCRAARRPMARPYDTLWPHHRTRAGAGRLQARVEADGGPGRDGAHSGVVNGKMGGLGRHHEDPLGGPGRSEDWQDDSGLGRVHAVRVEGALRRRDHHVLGRPPLRPDRPERRRQVHVHEAPDRRAAAAEGQRSAGRRKLGVLRQDQFAFDEFRVIDTVIMGNAGCGRRSRSASGSTPRPT